MKAYITLLSNAKYLEGVIVLYRSLQTVKSQYPLYCTLSTGVGEDLEKCLIQEGIKTIRLTSQIDTPNRISSDVPNAHWNNTFDKLQIWGLTQFEKLVFLDSDLLIINNIDSLFEQEPFSGVCAGKSYPGNEHFKGINSGVMVIVPDLKIKQELIGLIPTVSRAYQKQNRNMGDQDIIQWYLTEQWDNTPSLQLDEGYNVFADFLSYYIRNLGYSWNVEGNKIIYVIHFIGKTKPWMKHSVRELFWLYKMFVLNPYYYIAYKKYRGYLLEK